MGKSWRVKAPSALLAMQICEDEWSCSVGSFYSEELAEHDISIFLLF